MNQEVTFSTNDTLDSINDMLVPQSYYVGLVMVLYLKMLSPDLFVAHQGIRPYAMLFYFRQCPHCWIDCC